MDIPYWVLFDRRGAEHPRRAHHDQRRPGGRLQVVGDDLDGSEVAFRPAVLAHERQDRPSGRR